MANLLLTMPKIVLSMSMTKYTIKEWKFVKDVRNLIPNPLDAMTAGVFWRLKLSGTQRNAHLRSGNVYYSIGIPNYCPT